MNEPKPFFEPKEKYTVSELNARYEAKKQETLESKHLTDSVKTWLNSMADTTHTATLAELEKQGRLINDMKPPRTRGRGRGR